MIKILVKTSDNSLLPYYATVNSAGMDILSNEEKLIKPFQRVIINTGISIAIPETYEGQIRSRSGLARDHAVVVLNSPGTIDSDFRGELKILLINFGEKDFLVEKYMRIAQLVINQYVKAELITTDTLAETSRGNEGFGSTGLFKK